MIKLERVRKTEIPPLLHPPLAEVIFELRWEIENDEQTGRMRDPAYPMMYGRLYERFKKDFPEIEDLPSTQAHPEATPFIPRHRMRQGKNGYPLMQVGPGILTINMAKEYSWSTWKKWILRVIESVIELYSPTKIPLNFIKAEIRYVNAIRFDLARENPLSFLAEKLHTKIEIDSELFEKNQINHRPNSVGLNLAYVLDKPSAQLALSMNLGQFDGKPAYILQTLVHSFGEMVPSDKESFEPWLEDSHEVALHCFQVFCKGALMEKFGQ